MLRINLLDTDNIVKNKKTKKMQTNTTTPTCPNCGAQITCGCQRQTASNGAQVCNNCVAIYEKQLQNPS